MGVLPFHSSQKFTAVKDSLFLLKLHDAAVQVVALWSGIFQNLVLIVGALGRTMGVAKISCALPPIFHSKTPPTTDSHKREISGGLLTPPADTKSIGATRSPCCTRHEKFFRQDCEYHPADGTIVDAQTLLSRSTKKAISPRGSTRCSCTRRKRHGPVGPSRSQSLPHGKLATGSVMLNGS